MKNGFIAIVLISISLILNGCAQKFERAYHQNIKDINQTLAQSIAENEKLQEENFSHLPISVQQTLANYDAKPIVNSKKHFDVSADNLSIVTFLQAFARTAGINIVIDPKVTGIITLHLKHASIQNVFDVLSRLYGIDVYQSNKLYIATPAEIRTEIFHLNYLDIVREGTTEMTLNNPESVANTNGTEENNNRNRYWNHDNNNLEDTKATSLTSTFSTANFWKNLQASLNEIIGSNAKNTANNANVTIDPLSGIIVVKAYPKGLAAAAAFIKEVQEYTQQEVIIQAQILDVKSSTSLSTSLSLGFPKGAISLGPDSNSFIFNSKGTGNGSIPINNGSAVSLRLGGFSAIVNALEKYGQVSVLSSPQISTLNNQKALIKVGNVSFHVTSIQTNSTPTTTTTTQTQDFDFEPFFSGIALDVTPQISFNNEVILHIHPMVTQVRQDMVSVPLGNNATETQLPFASTSIREADTIVRARSGQIVIIGGLMENNADVDDGGIPGLGQSLATGHNDQDAKSNLVILLKPIVVGNTNGWQDALKKANQSFLAMQGNN